MKMSKIIEQAVEAFQKGDRKWYNTLADMVMNQYHITGDIFNEIIRDEMK